MSERDEIIYVPEKPMGGFRCPKCLDIMMGKKWASHANYCPDCGQHIKIIAPDKFQEYKTAVKSLPEETRDKCITTCQIISSGGNFKEEISGVYRDRLKKIQDDLKGIEGQMNISDFI